MKICRFLQQNTVFYGAFHKGRVYPFPESGQLGDISEEVSLKESFDLSQISLLPPVTPSKIVCVGRNYAEHAAELGNEVPREPLLFLKAPSALITEGETIRIPEISKQVEHEGELAVIIGRQCRRLTENENPFEYVFGYTCLNDVTARDLQRRDVQFTRAKSFDTFCPVGAFIETDLDVSDLQVTTRVNGLVKQSASTSQMVFPVDFLIRYISHMMTLNAGDIIATGTPSGVSKLSEGDVCEVEISGIGILRNPVA